MAGARRPVLCEVPRAGTLPPLSGFPLLAVFPVVFSLAGREIHAHVVFEALGYTVAFQCYRYLRRRAHDPVSDLSRWTVIAAAAVGAVVGSKLLYLLEDPPATWAHRGDLAFLLGGKTIVGGILGAWILVEFVKRRIGVTSRTGDLFAAPLLIGIAIGRIGCFCEGLADHTYGVPTSLPFGVDFGDGVPRHPTQIYEMIFALAVAAPLWRATLRKDPSRRQGDLFRAAVGAYLLWRFVIDFLKPHPSYLVVSGIQVAALFGVLYVVSGWKRDRGVRT